MPKNCWSAVKALVCARLSVAEIFPEVVMGDEPMVREFCASVNPTEVTVAEF